MVSTHVILFSVYGGAYHLDCDVLLFPNALYEFGIGPTGVWRGGEFEPHPISGEIPDHGDDLPDRGDHLRVADPPACPDQDEGRREDRLSAGRRIISPLFLIGKNRVTS